MCQASDVLLIFNNKNNLHSLVVTVSLVSLCQLSSTSFVILVTENDHSCFVVIRSDVSGIEKVATHECGVYSSPDNVPF